MLKQLSRSYNKKFSGPVYSETQCIFY